MKNGNTNRPIGDRSKKKDISIYVMRPSKQVYERFCKV